MEREGLEWNWNWGRVWDGRRWNRSAEDAGFWGVEGCQRTGIATSRVLPSYVPDFNVELWWLDTSSAMNNTDPKQSSPQEATKEYATAPSHFTAYCYISEVVSALCISRSKAAPPFLQNAATCYAMKKTNRLRARRPYPFLDEQHYQYHFDCIEVAWV